MMRPFFSLMLLGILSGCSVQGLQVKGKPLQNYLGSATAQEVYQTPSGLVMKAVLHVHTNLSHAALSPEEVVQVAKSRGVAVVAFAEHDNLEVCWGPLFCFRQHSVQRMGYEAYLSRMEAIQKDNPEVIVVPGLEISPYAWW